MRTTDTTHESSTRDVAYEWATVRADDETHEQIQLAWALADDEGLIPQDRAQMLFPDNPYCHAAMPWRNAVDLFGGVILEVSEGGAA